MTGETKNTQGKISRREFLDRIWAASAGAGFLAIAGGLVAFFWPKKLSDLPEEPVEVGTLAELEEKGFIELPYGRHPAIVLRRGEGDYIAYSRTCTHFSCTTEYRPDEDRFYCPCHEAFFEGEDGSVISGPPNKPLRQFDFFIDGDTLFLGTPPEPETSWLGRLTRKA